jgi:hypothetical protein
MRGLKRRKKTRQTNSGRFTQRATDGAGRGLCQSEWAAGYILALDSWLLLDSEPQPTKAAGATTLIADLTFICVPPVGRRACSAGSSKSCWIGVEVFLTCALVPSVVAVGSKLMRTNGVAHPGMDLHRKIPLQFRYIRSFGGARYIRIASRGCHSVPRGP